MGKKYLFSIIITIVLVFNSIMAFGSEIPQQLKEEELKALEVCGLIPVFEYEKFKEKEVAHYVTHRIQAAAIILRLNGVVEKAGKWDGNDFFVDVKNPNRGYTTNLTAYLKSNPQYGFTGYPDGTFNPDKLISSQEYYKVLLTLLGYVQDEDFKYEDTVKFAKAKGLYRIADITELKAKDIAVGVVEALKCNVKNEDITLVENLIKKGIIKKDDAAVKELKTKLGIKEK